MITVELPTAVHCNLVAYYREVFAQEDAQTVEPAKFVSMMPNLAQFMSTDHVFTGAMAVKLSNRHPLHPFSRYLVFPLSTLPSR
jgi:hypothetical protein